MLRFLCLPLFFIACNAPVEKAEVIAVEQEAEVCQIKNANGETVEERFNPPKGFERGEVKSGSFAEYLRSLPLKVDGAPVKFYDGSVKPRSPHAAVIDLDVGTRDLQQCADAIMRLRGEYLFEKKEYDSIAFHFVNGFLAEYSRWAKGERISVRGNKTSWYAAAQTDYTHDNFMKYLNMVYSFASTLSLSKELKFKDFQNLDIGDVFIQGGAPGHAMIVVDLAENDKGEKAFLLAQSYMPAQSIHIVKNPENAMDSPWYILGDINSVLETPSWNFYLADLHSF